VAETALVVKIPQAEPAFEQLRQEHDPSARDGMPCHLTILYPFVEVIEASVLDELRATLAGWSAFELELGRLERFAGEEHVLYAAPDPAEPFVAMTGAVCTRFGLLPYGGVHDEVLPHMTIAISNDPAVLDGIEPMAAAGLPIRTRVEVVDLAVREPDGWRMAHSIPLA
jgi:2'-5' RNA ligase